MINATKSLEADWLSIVIPTYNRAAILDETLKNIIPLLRPHAIGLYISDNASSDSTRDVVFAHAAGYPHIHYLRNDSNVGADMNFEIALKQARSKYVWLLGDSYRFTGDALEYLSQRIGSEAAGPDAFLFNVGGEIRYLPSTDYTDADALLKDLAWLTTCLSTIVFSSRMIEAANFARYRDTNFIHTGILYEYVASRVFKVAWNAEVSIIRWVNRPGLKKDEWLDDKLFEIWYERRVNLFLSLPPIYSVDSKLKSALSNGPSPRVYFIQLLRLRYRKILTWKYCIRYSGTLRLALGVERFYVYAVALFPQNFAKLMIAAYNGLRRIKRGIFARLIDAQSSLIRQPTQ